MAQCPENDKFISCFEKLYLLRVQEGEEWRAKAYTKAIEALRVCNFPITSGQMAQSLSGIGKSIASKIDLILKDGTLPELKDFDSTHHGQKDILDLFRTIHGVGDKTAQRWYDWGYRTIDDVPESILTSAQKIAIQLNSELVQRIPRAEVDVIQARLKEFLEPRQIHFEICGSYRRGRPDCGDVDILVIAQPGRDILSEVLECPIFIHTLARGPKKFLGIGKVLELHRRIDVEIVQPEEYPYAVVYFTGSGSFNKKMREHTAQLGYRLNEKSLTDPAGNHYPAQSEEHVFQLLGLRYLTPQERDNY